MRLSRPGQAIFIVSLVLALVGLLAGATTILVLPLSAFWIMTAAYAVLAVGCLMRGA